jgi:type I restriction-modification system DNA methylase subunit
LIIIKVVAPEIGNTIYDGAVGSAGFLWGVWLPDAQQN